MGSDLLQRGTSAPRFLVWALRDAHAGWLQRVQVVKGWIEDGKAQERCSTWRARMSSYSTGARWRCGGQRCGGRPARPASPSENKGAVELQVAVVRPDLHARTSARSTTCACSRTRRAAGRPGTRSAPASSRIPDCRRRSRSAPRARRSGTFPADLTTGAGLNILRACHPRAAAAFRPDRRAALAVHRACAAAAGPRRDPHHRRRGRAARRALGDAVQRKPTAESCAD